MQGGRQRKAGVGLSGLREEQRLKCNMGDRMCVRTGRQGNHSRRHSEMGKDLGRLAVAGFGG